MNEHIYKIQFPQGMATQEETLILAKGIGKILFVFRTDKWNVFEKEFLSQISTVDRDSRLLLKHLLGSSVLVDVNGNCQIEIPTMLYHYLGSENAEVRVCPIEEYMSGKPQESNILNIISKYVSYVIVAEE